MMPCAMCCVRDVCEFCGKMSLCPRSFGRFQLAVVPKSRMTKEQNRLYSFLNIISHDMTEAIRTLNVMIDDSYSLEAEVDAISCSAPVACSCFLLSYSIDCSCSSFIISLNLYITPSLHSYLPPWRGFFHSFSLAATDV